MNITTEQYEYLNRIRRAELNAVSDAEHAWWSAKQAYKSADNCYKREDALLRRLAKEMNEAEAEVNRLSWEFHTNWSG